LRRPRGLVAQSCNSKRSTLQNSTVCDSSFPASDQIGEPRLDRMPIPSRSQMHEFNLCVLPCSAAGRSVAEYMNGSPRCLRYSTSPESEHEQTSKRLLRSPSTSSSN